MEFLEKLEGLRHLERLDNDTLMKAYHNHQTKQFFKKKVMPIEELQEYPDLDIDDQERIIESL